jgi:hypothetical protein
LWLSPDAHLRFKSWPLSSIFIPVFHARSMFQAVYFLWFPLIWGRNSDQFLRVILPFLTHSVTRNFFVIIYCVSLFIQNSPVRVLVLVSLRQNLNSDVFLLFVSSQTFESKCFFCLRLYMNSL